MVTLTSTKPSPFPSFSLCFPPFVSSSSVFTISFPCNSFHRRLRRQPVPLRLRALDAAQPYDYESHLQTQLLRSQSLKIGILGFGNFGQFLSKTLSRQGHTLLAYSRTDYSAVAGDLGVNFFTNPHDFCESHPEVVVLCTSILSTEKGKGKKMLCRGV